MDSMSAARIPRTAARFGWPLPPVAGGDPEGDPPADPPVDPAPVGDPPADPPPADPETFDLAYVKKLRKEAAEARTAGKAAREQLQAIEDANKTEAEKAAERLAAAEGQVPTLLRRAVAAELGLPPELAQRLVGDDEDTLRADAESLKALLAPVADPNPPPVDPAAPWPRNTQPGPRGDGKAPTIAQQIAAAEAAGNYGEATRLRMTQVAQQTPVGS